MAWLGCAAALERDRVVGLGLSELDGVVAIDLVLERVDTIENQTEEEEKQDSTHRE
ncbi:MAG: hypothetical protein Q8P67_16805 [archaeon]|nr:hypothetical protein [archaeon]